VSLRSWAERTRAAVERVAAVVVVTAGALAAASFLSALVISLAVFFELEQRPVHWVLAIVALASLLSVPGWVLLTFRSVVSSAREIPAAVGAWSRRARHHHQQITTADGGVSTGVAAARAAWAGGREVGLVKAGLAATRLSFLLVALICAVLVPVEVALALVVVLATAAL
jgi:hypothetical protein